jgi:3-oxoadipate enol-lactonase
MRHQPAIVLGKGYGGFVALQMAIRHGGIASRFIFADCGAAFSEAGREAFLFAPEFQAEHPELMADRRAAFLRTDEEVFRAACARLAELDLRPDLHQVKAPALVGEQDEATPPPMSHELAAGLLDARLKIIAGCAHVRQLQSPKVFLDAMADFLPFEKQKRHTR